MSFYKNCYNNFMLNKEEYFTAANIRQKSRAMLKKLIKRSRKPKGNPFGEHPALLILDMQRYFLESGSHAFIPSAGAVIPVIRELRDLFLKKGFPVIFTRHVNTAEDAGMMASYWRDLLQRDSPMSGFSTLLPPGDRTVVEKKQYDAFFGTELDNILRNEAVDMLVITGLCTHLCCESTARSSFIRGYKTIIPVDGTATFNEELHLCALLGLMNGFSDPFLTEDILEYYEKN